MRGCVLLLLALSPVACSGSQTAADFDWSPEPPQKEIKGRETEALNAAQPLNPETEKQWAWLGVRHDLMLSPSAHEARCGCLAVEVGQPGDKSFFWMGSPPDAGSEALAIAIGSRGVACPGGDPDERRRRPSISAVDQENGNIIIEVEDLAPGRPLASGAIIPKPAANGGIFIRPRGAAVVYGRSVGVARCRVR